MTKVVRRGYVLKDEKEFNQDVVKKLRLAGEDLQYLLNKGYKIKGASTFIGNHFLLSERQRLAITRAISSTKHIENRNKKLKAISSISNQTVHIDGFNTIISIEVALSNSLLLKCNDGTIRDLAGLRGTYKLIDKTDMAINLIGQNLSKAKVEKVVFYLDAPVSNSGNLKIKIIELLKEFDFELEVLVINGVDTTLEKLDNVITSDAIILDKCISWINLNSEIIENDLKKKTISL